MQEADTTLSGAAVLTAAKEVFGSRSGIYTAFLEKEGPTHLVLRGQGGEEIVLGVAELAGCTQVTGSSYLFDQQVARFLSTLPPAAAEPSA